MTRSRSSTGSTVTLLSSTDSRNIGRCQQSSEPRDRSRRRGSQERSTRKRDRRSRKQAKSGSTRRNFDGFRAEKRNRPSPIRAFENRRRRLLLRLPLETSYIPLPSTTCRIRAVRNFPLKSVGRCPPLVPVRHLPDFLTQRPGLSL